MAIFDLRLLELVETLVAARLDWLAIELVEGVKTGWPPEETGEELAAVRESIRGNSQPKPRGEPQAIAVETKPIPLDEQVEWAAGYVEERLGEVLEQLQVSIDTLDLVVEGGAERPDKTVSAAQPTDAAEPKAIVVRLDLEGGRESGRDDVASARASFPSLRTALAEWTAQSSGQATTR